MRPLDRTEQKVILAGAIVLTVISGIMLFPLTALDPVTLTLFLAACAYSVAWIAQYYSKRLRQKLLISVPPIPPNTTDEGLHLLLNHDDAMIYGYLIKHAARKNATLFVYKGRPIYSQQTRTFELGEHACRPAAINVTVEH